jgi:hypothetical protein
MVLGSVVLSRSDVRGRGYGLGWLAGRGHVTCTSIVVSFSLRNDAALVSTSADSPTQQKKKKKKSKIPQNTPTYLEEDKKAHILLPLSLPNEHQSCVLPEPRKKNAAFVRSM